MVWAHGIAKFPKSLERITGPFQGLNQLSWKVKTCFFVEKACTWRQRAFGVELQSLGDAYGEFFVLGEQRPDSKRMIFTHNDARFVVTVRPDQKCPDPDDVQRLIKEIAARHGFKMYGQFWYHPDELPFMSELSTEEPLGRQPRSLKEESEFEGTAESRKGEEDGDQQPLAWLVQSLVQSPLVDDAASWELE
jgi:hypothetical protein